MTEQTITREWFCEEVVRHQTALFRTARSILKNNQDAEDAVQEAICSAYASRKQLRDPALFKPWLLRILTNKCYDICRKTHPTVDLSDVEDTLPASGTDCTDKITLWQAVLQLPGDLRSTISLFYYEGLSIRQISETLGLTETAVKTRLSRGRQKLRILLKEE